MLTSWYLEELYDLGDDEIALRPNFDVKNPWSVSVENHPQTDLYLYRNRSQVFTSKCGP